MTRLARLRGDNFRLFQSLDWQPHPRQNWVVGANAAGKTSLLEAVYCLGRGKSFRGNSPSELAGKTGRYWQLSGDFRRSDRPPQTVKLKWEPQGLQIRQEHDRELRLADLVAAWPIQVFEPSQHRLLQEGPSYRRSFLDWGVFHVEPSFYPLWRRNQRALQQRNRALRTGRHAVEIQSWHDELAQTAEALHALRAQHLEALRPHLAAHVNAIFGDLAWSADLHPGWSAESDYRAGLDRHLERDRRLGMTHEGAHRAELRLKIDDAAVRNRISRGQQKLLIAALLLAQAQHIHRITERPPILLIDDFAAELAPAFQALFLTLLAAHPGQLFLTGFEPPTRPLPEADVAVFHVEHGSLSRV